MKGGERLDVEVVVTATAAFVDDPVRARDTDPVITGTATNVLTSPDLTLDNFERLFSRPDFWHVLRVSLYYTVFGTAGALVLGLFAAQLLDTTFHAREAWRPQHRHRRPVRRGAARADEGGLLVRTRLARRQLHGEPRTA